MIFLQGQTETEFAFDGPNSQAGRRIDVGSRNYRLLFAVSLFLTFYRLVDCTDIGMGARFGRGCPVVGCHCLDCL